MNPKNLWIMQKAFTNLLTMEDNFFLIVGIYFSLLMAKPPLYEEIFMSLRNCVAPNAFGRWFVSVAFLGKQAAALALACEQEG